MGFYIAAEFPNIFASLVHPSLASMTFHPVLLSCFSTANTLRPKVEFVCLLELHDESDFIYFSVLIWRYGQKALLYLVKIKGLLSVVVTVFMLHVWQDKMKTLYA